MQEKKANNPRCKRANCGNAHWSRATTMASEWQPQASPHTQSAEMAHSVSSDGIHELCHTPSETIHHVHYQWSINASFLHSLHSTLNIHPLWATRVSYWQAQQHLSTSTHINFNSTSYNHWGTWSLEKACRECHSVQNGPPHDLSWRSLENPMRCWPSSAPRGTILFVWCSTCNNWNNQQPTET